MADRNPRNRRGPSYRDNDDYRSRQAEQFQDDRYETDSRSRFGGQMGDEGRMSGETYTYDDVDDFDGPRRGEGRGYGGRNRDRGFDQSAGSYGQSRYDDRAGRGGGQSSRGYRGSRNPAYDYHGDYDDHDRGFFEKAGDEIASWFGDDEAARRRQEDHRGRGPSNYTRSDDRILEDACDNLTDDWAVDARNIQVSVKDSEITLDGTVDSRAAKRRAEDCVDCISGVKHVQNNLRVQDRVGDNADYSERELENGRI